MKKIIYTLLYSMLALSMTACLGDDDNDDTFQLEVQTKILLGDMYGKYSGRLTTSNKDTINNVEWKVDTTLHVNSLPDTLFAKCLAGHEELAAALNCETTTDIHAPLVFAQQASNDGSVRAFYLYPYILKKKMTYGGKEHTVEYVFANYPYSYGYFNKNGVTTFQIVLLTILEDSKQITDVKQTSFIFTNSYAQITK